MILSDSGGVQEEAPALEKPVLVLRSVTERPEALTEGTAVLVGTDEERIFSAAYRLLTDPEAYGALARKGMNPFGKGDAAEKICEALLSPMGGLTAGGSR
jgi:UDP-N-acetylglucosamine 2-epimerase (non-hydrolysing)